MLSILIWCDPIELRFCLLLPIPRLARIYFYMDNGALLFFVPFIGILIFGVLVVDGDGLFVGHFGVFLILGDLAALGIGMGCPFEL